MIAQVDEQQIAMVALAVHPARQLHALADVALRGARRNCGYDRRASGIAFEIGRLAERARERFASLNGALSSARQRRALIESASQATMHIHP